MSPRGSWAYGWPKPASVPPPQTRAWREEGEGRGEGQTQPFRLKPTGSNGAQIPPHNGKDCPLGLRVGPGGNLPWVELWAPLALVSEERVPVVRISQGYPGMGWEGVCVLSTVPDTSNDTTNLGSHFSTLFLLGCAWAQPQITADDPTAGPRPSTKGGDMRAVLSWNGRGIQATHPWPRLRAFSPTVCPAPPGGLSSVHQASHRHDEASGTWMSSGWDPVTHQVLSPPS